MNPIIANGPQGAADVINAVTTELKAAMARTCCGKITDIDSSLIWRRNGTRL